ncbi:MAG: DUF2190 family protein [Verrucomicrobia bacterium]|nr:DUF2190 family protein [Verrucomicrobiota bacterium]
MKLCYAAKRGTADNKVVPAEDGNARCHLVVGELPDAGTSIAAGYEVDVAMDVPERECFFKTGGAVTQGDPLMPTTGGSWITGTTGNYCGGIALESGASGDVIRGLAQTFLFKT